MFAAILARERERRTAAWAIEEGGGRGERRQIENPSSSSRQKLLLPHSQTTTRDPPASERGNASLCLSVLDAPKCVHTRVCVREWQEEESIFGKGENRENWERGAERFSACPNSQRDKGSKQHLGITTAAAATTSANARRLRRNNNNKQRRPISSSNIRPHEV